MSIQDGRRFLVRSPETRKDLARLPGAMPRPLPASMLHVLHDQAERMGDRPALWSRRNGYYLPTSWREYAARVRHFALGLHRLGFGPGDVLAVLAFNREEWVVAQLAAMALGGVAVGLY